VAELEIQQKKVMRDRYEYEWIASVEKNRVARHEYESKRRFWELHQIRSPIAGEVTKVYKRAGEGVKAGETVVRVANFDRLYVEGAIPLPMRNMVRPGMRVLVEPERQQGWLRELRGHTATVTGISLTPDGRFLVSSGEDGRVVIWDWQFSAQRPVELRDSKFSREYGCVACSPVVERRGGTVSYQIFAGAADGRIRVWSVEVSASGQIQRRNLKVMGEVVAIHRTPIRCLAVSPDGKFVASGSEDGDICLTSLETGQALCKLRDARSPREAAHRAAVTSLGFLPEGDLVSASQDRTLARWQLGQDSDGSWTSQLVWRIEGRSADVSQLGITRDGQRALFENGEELRILDLRDGQTLTVISSRRSGHFRSVAIFSPDGRQVLTTTAGGRLHLWNVPPTREEAAWLRLAYRNGFKYHTPMVLGALNAGLSANGHAMLPGWLAFAQTPSPMPSDHGLILASQSPGLLPPASAPEATTQVPELWPIDARELRLYSMSDPSSVTCAAFSPDGRYCFTGGSDKVIRVWPAPTLDETIRPLEGVLVYVGQQVESGGGLVRIRAELENPRQRSARLELGVRVTLTVLPDFRP
jgi:WD40 repeat protein